MGCFLWGFVCGGQFGSLLSGVTPGRGCRGLLRWMEELGQGVELDASTPSLVELMSRTAPHP